MGKLLYAGSVNRRLTRAEAAATGVQLVQQLPTPRRGLNRREEQRSTASNRTPTNPGGLIGAWRPRGIKRTTQLRRRESKRGRVEERKDEENQEQEKEAPAFHFPIVESSTLSKPGTLYSFPLHFLHLFVSISFHPLKFKSFLDFDVSIKNNSNKKESCI